MVSEITMIMLMMLFIKQANSLWTSLLLIPISMIMVISLVNKTFMSLIISLMFVLVFVGGLLVLLVSVAAFSYQEQDISPLNKTVSLGVSIVLALSLVLLYFDENSAALILFSWLGFNRLVLCFLLSILTTALVIITWFFAKQKSFARPL